MGTTTIDRAMCLAVAFAPSLRLPRTVPAQIGYAPAILQAGGVESVKIPARSSNCNPHAERLVKTIKYECLNQFVIFDERHLRYLIKEFVEH